MLICAMTGSIATGKSTTAGMFRRFGIPIFDADAAVHRLYAGRVVPFIEAEFPGTTSDGRVDRKKLGEAVLGDKEKLSRLESLVHVMVAEDRKAFLSAAQEAGRHIVLLDVPLHFETGGDRYADLAIVVTATAEIQRRRVLERPDMDEEKLKAISDRQMPDAEKRRRAHFLVDTSHGIESAERQVLAILRAIAFML